MTMLIKFKKTLLTPKDFYLNTKKIIPFVAISFLLLFCYGFIFGLFIVPPDYQQGDCFRIIYVHVPSAFAAMGIYLIMAVCALITLVWRIKTFAIGMSCSAAIGAWFTLLALITGSIWGKPMWGTWWIWDARLTSVLILLFLYVGFLALQASLPKTQSRDRACAILVLTGVINLPIIHYSVIWWNTLHQGPTIARLSPTMDTSMLYPLLAMIAAFFLFYFLNVLIRMRNLIISNGKL